jgi:hypothetical protein
MDQERIGGYTIHVSIVLIIGTIIIFQQIKHVKGRTWVTTKTISLSVDARGDVVKNFA